MILVIIISLSVVSTLQIPQKAIAQAHPSETAKVLVDVKGALVHLIKQQFANPTNNSPRMKTGVQQSLNGRTVDNLTSGTSSQWDEASKLNNGITIISRYTSLKSQS